MPSTEIELVLANWIEEAQSSSGILPPGTKPSKWVAERFLHWWRKSHDQVIDDSLGDAEAALRGIETELHRQGGWEKFGEALHECAHLKDALSSLRATLPPSA